MRRLKFDWSWDSIKWFGCVYSDRFPSPQIQGFGPDEISVDDVMEVQRHLRRKPSSRRTRRQKRAEFLDCGSRIDRISFYLFPTVGFQS